MPGFQCLPWRSVWLPRAVTAVALIIGLPLFLRSPPWCDITLYQLAARNILTGGAHYRDIFDTNLPGFVWVMTALYKLFGPNVIAVRITDLLIVLGVVLLIDRLAKQSGATLATRWWAFAGFTLFYLFTMEMSHAQRDAWMALPSMLAVVLRVRRGIAPPNREREGTEEVWYPRPTSRGSPFLASFWEGVLWGAGVWIKPHVAIMALTVWLLTAWRLAAEYERPRRAATLDLLGNLLGGIAIAIPGIAWLVASDSWSGFLEVFQKWNPYYVKLAQEELFTWRYSLELFWFPVWSLGLILTVPLALVSVVDMAFWLKRSSANIPARQGPLSRWLPWQLWDKQIGADARFVRGVMSGLYLAWVCQAFFVQRGMQYVHIPETLLMIGIWASHRWAWTPLALLWLAASSTLWIAADYSPPLQEQLRCFLSDRPAMEREAILPRHAITSGKRLRAWPDCWRLEMSDTERYVLWDKLQLHPPHEAVIGWEEIAEVAEFLRGQGVRDGEVVAWFDSTHVVYLLLDIKPGFRYMHVYTALAIAGDDDEVGFKRVCRDYDDTEKNVRFVISDLEWVIEGKGPEFKREDLVGPAEAPPEKLLPVVMPNRDLFPFNRPAVFRSRGNNGRYIVHRVVPKDCQKP